MQKDYPYYYLKNERHNMKQEYEAIKIFRGVEQYIKFKKSPRRQRKKERCGEKSEKTNRELASQSNTRLLGNPEKEQRKLKSKSSINNSRKSPRKEVHEFPD